MALDFPSDPTQGQTFQDPASGVVWVFDTGKWRSGAGGGAYLPLSGGALTGALAGVTGAFSGVVSGADPPPGDSSGKFATTAWINNNRPQNRNRIINGDFRVNQWNAGTSITPTAGQYVSDRWKTGMSSTGNFTVLSTAWGAGLSVALQFTSTSAYTSLATDNFYVTQPIEFVNVADFCWGSAQATTATLSFLAFASSAGSYSGAIVNDAGTRSYPFTFTLPANVWTYITITIPGDTQGIWYSAANGVGVNLRLDLGSGANFRAAPNSWQAGNLVGATGATSLVATAGATLSFTNVQLELGAQATSFDWRPYGEELALCQRYYQIISASWWGSTNNTGNYSTSISLPTPMRASPTVETLTSSFIGISGFNSVVATTNTLEINAGGQANINASYAMNWALNAEL